ncbi:MAG: ABC transporter ATP-binding protein [Archangiaceae bacterium]|nr:ABC transporter ATP-binding protein [Archangiaceae bacterium]
MLPHWQRLGLAVLASLVAASAAALWARLLGPLLESLLTHPPQAQTLTLTWLPLLIIATALLKALAQLVHGGLMQSIAQRVLADFRHQLYAKLLGLPPSWHEQRHSGELLTRFTADVAALELTVSTSLSTYLKDTFTVLALLAVCATTDWRLAVLAFLVIPAMTVPVSRFAKSLKRIATQTQGSLSNLTRLTAEQLHNLPVVQAYRAEPQALQAFDDEQRRYLHAMKRSLFVRGAFTPTLEMMGIAAIALCLIAGARAVANEPQLSGSLLSFLAAALLMYQPLKGLSGTFSEVARGLSSADRLYEILDTPIADETGDEAPPLEHLELDTVSLRYPDGREALREVSLSVPAHQTTALIGPSGAGKSSVLSLILGLQRPTQGTVRWNGRPLSSWSLSSLRRRIAWVSQEPLLLSGTVRENLKLGAATATDEALWSVLERAHAADFVRALPNGLDEEVGERGQRLSGGQRQRLAIARALLTEPSLLLLDEPTSSLDETAQAEVQRSLGALVEGRTVLVVAHRLSTVAHANLIHVLESGRLVRTGPPADVLPR